MITNVLEYLEASAEHMPHRTAVADSEKSLSYQELCVQAKQAATFICKQGNFHNRPIAVAIDRNVESLVLFLGVVYSGNFYVPIDDTMPAQRIRLILDTLQPVLVLRATRGEAWEGFPTAFFADVIGGGEICTERLEAVRRRALDTDPLYAIFTSGSTGVPKGVLIGHRSVIDLVEQFGKTFAFPKDPVFGNQAPFDFDVSVKDIYNAFRLGGTVEIIPKQLFSFPGQLIPYLNERRVNVIIWAVSALRIVANFKTFSKCRPRYLELVMFSGEVMPVKVLNYWRETVDKAQYVNLYGPTEITCNCSYYIVDRPFSNEENLPIGAAFDNTEIFLLDTEKNSLISAEEPGRVGEICVKGTCLGLGYYNNPEKTAEAFVQNPLNPWYPETVYRTGDLGQYGGDGKLYFAARKDFQIKHMGHRIELGEIETAVNALDFIETACCVYDGVREKIVLCYQAREACDKKIVGELAKALPKYMWPNRYAYYERIPLNKNGKMDRVLLTEKHCQGK